MKTVFWAVVFFGVVTRFLHVDRPLDHRLLAEWRQADYTQLARNFYREDWNLFRPRIDWRGDTPGLVEMELPLLPWLAGSLYRAVGYDERIIRLLAAISSALGLLVFAALSRSILPPAGAVLAIGAYVANPILWYLSSAMQPEAVMLLFSLAAVWLMLRWQEAPKDSTLLLAAGAIALATLAKTPAGLLGFVLVYAVFRRWRLGAFRVWAAYAALLVVAVPPLIWSAWAHRYWTLYGNSLGLSNESHLIGWDLLFPPTFLRGNIEREIGFVFTLAGCLLVLAALVRRDRRLNLILFWYGAVWAFYIAAARTSGDDWAWYYHALSVAPACLLMGEGFGRVWRWAASVEHRFGRVPVGQMACALLAAVIGVSLSLETGAILARRDGRDDLEAMRECLLQFEEHVGQGEMIVVQGGAAFDATGHRVAYNESMAFAWMDRRGFNFPAEQLSLSTLRKIAERGGRYWIVRREELRSRGLLDTALFHYVQVAECAPDYLLLDLGQDGDTP